MISFLVLLLFCLGPSTFARCERYSEDLVIGDATYILEGEVLKANFRPSELSTCEGKKKLRYSIKVTDSLGKKVSPGEYSLSHDYDCGHKPNDMFFKVGQSYLFAIKKVEKTNIEILGVKCGWWGWEVSRKKEISSKVKSYGKP